MHKQSKKLHFCIDSVKVHMHLEALTRKRKWKVNVYNNISLQEINTIYINT